MKTIIDKNSKMSPFYKTTDYIANVDKLVQEGIVQNLEQRAFLETIKDELVTTFDATNDTLERLVRIQNEDADQGDDEVQQNTAGQLAPIDTSGIKSHNYSSPFFRVETM